MNTTFPTHPKRHLVIRRWGLEPEQHQINRDRYRADTYQTGIDPSTRQHLLAREQFNVTPKEF